MSLYIRDTQTVPQDGWTYPGLAGYVISTRNYSILYEEIVRHYTANGQPAPSQESVTQYLCEHLPIPCYEGNQPFVNNWTLGIAPAPRKCC